MSIDHDGLGNEEFVSNISLGSDGIDGVHIDSAELQGSRGVVEKGIGLMRWRGGT